MSDFNIKALIDGSLRKLTCTVLDEGEADERRALDVVQHNQVVKRQYTHADVVDGVITIDPELGAVSYFEIINESNDNGLSFTINGVTITLDKKDVDAKGLPLTNSFGDDFAKFTTVEVNGTDLNFKALVKG